MAFCSSKEGFLDSCAIRTAPVDFARWVHHSRIDTGTHETGVQKTAAVVTLGNESSGQIGSEIPFCCI